MTAQMDFPFEQGPVNQVLSQLFIKIPTLLPTSSNRFGTKVFPFAMTGEIQDFPLLVFFWHIPGREGHSRISLRGMQGNVMDGKPSGNSQGQYGLIQIQE
jgi:hypothetical protein